MLWNTKAKNTFNNELLKTRRQKDFQSDVLKQRYQLSQKLR